MVEFAGYSLPVQYEGLGVLKEHVKSTIHPVIATANNIDAQVHTRAPNSASLFDVSHMGQIKWHGKDAIKFLEQLVVGDLASLKHGEGKLSLIMNEEGGIVDDTVITNAHGYVYMVVNGACKYKDMEHFKKYILSTPMEVSLEYLNTQQLVALQGKGAMDVMKRITPDIDYTKMNFMTGFDTKIAGAFFVP